jgi:hypothetical protein
MLQRKLEWCSRHYEVVQFPLQSKENFEYDNITSPDVMKNYDTVSSAIPL